MGLLNWLFGRATQDFDAPPGTEPPVIAIKEDDLEMLRGDEVFDAEGDEPLFIDDIFTVIDYSDAAGNRTRRRIKMIELAPGPVAPIVRAICLERRAIRNFRLDRIEVFIDTDGVISSPGEFLAEIGIQIIGDQKKRPEAQDMELRKHLRPALNLLMVTAACDNEVHPAEIDAILEYAESEALHLDLPTTERSIAALAATIRRMRPPASRIADYYGDVSGFPPKRQHRFISAFKNVILADGVLKQEEWELAEQINQLSGGAIADLDELFS